MNSRVIYYIALALFSIIYVILSPHTPYPGSILLKAIPIWLVAGHVFLTLKDLKGRLLFIGLMFGSAGDIALATDYSLSFMIGLGFFLIGHLFYIACFSRQWKFQPVRLIPAGLVMILSIGLSIALTPRLGGLTIPVYAYVFIITLMVIFAVFRGAPSPAVWIGAVLFLLFGHVTLRGSCPCYFTESKTSRSFFFRFAVATSEPLPYVLRAGQDFPGITEKQ